VTHEQIIALLKELALPYRHFGQAVKGGCPSATAVGMLNTNYSTLPTVYAVRLSA
jgi:hypothetical protein